MTTRKIEITEWVGSGGDKSFLRKYDRVNVPEAKTGGGFPSRLSTSVLKSGILGSSYATTSLQNAHVKKSVKANFYKRY